MPCHTSLWPQIHRLGISVLNHSSTFRGKRLFPWLLFRKISLNIKVNLRSKRHRKTNKQFYKNWKKRVGCEKCLLIFGIYKFLCKQNCLQIHTMRYEVLSYTKIAFLSTFLFQQYRPHIPSLVHGIVLNKTPGCVIQ